VNNAVKEGMFGEPAVALYYSLYRLGRKTSRNDQKIIEQYFAQPAVKKLQLLRHQ
jgi:hypothetical protein